MEVDFTMIDRKGHVRTWHEATKRENMKCIIVVRTLVPASRFARGDLEYHERRYGIGMTHTMPESVLLIFFFGFWSLAFLPRPILILILISIIARSPLFSAF